MTSAVLKSSFIAFSIRCHAFTPRCLFVQATAYCRYLGTPSPSCRGSCRNAQPLSQTLLRESARVVDWRAVLVGEQEETNSLVGLSSLAHLVYVEDIAYRLAHLLLFDIYKTVVEPVPGKWRRTCCSLALCNFIFVVWKYKVFTASVYIYCIGPS